MKDCAGETEDAAREEESLRNAHVVDFDRSKITAVNPVAIAT